MSKFAPITSRLVGRRADTVPAPPPSVVPFRLRSEPFEPEARLEEMPFALSGASGEGPASAKTVFGGKGGSHGPRPPERQSGALRRISVALSAEEHETLGIVAVKRGLTRHQVVRNALDAHLAELAREYRTQCSCIATGCSCSGRCPVG